MLQEHSTTHAVVDIKPPVKVSIECLNVLRQIDGQVIIQKSNHGYNSSLSQSSSKDDYDEKLQQIELLRHENEQLRSELNVHKTEISVLRVERDSLMNTITKLDNGLTDAENHRITQ